MARPVEVPGDTVQERIAARIALRREATAAAAAAAGKPVPPVRPSSFAPVTGTTARPSTVTPRPATTTSSSAAPAGSAAAARPSFATERPRLDTRRPPTPGGSPTPPKRPVAPLVAPSPAEIEAAVDHEAYERFSAGVKALLGFDLTQYKRPQVWRRSNSFAKQKGCANTDELIERCKTDLDLRTAMRDMITINVSEFFRNPEAWEALRTVALPELLKLGRPIRMWSAGCSLGYEPYTFAMLVKESGSGADTRIMATDLDETILAVARASAYAEHQMVGVSPARRARFFEQRDAQWVVKQELRGLVQWRRQDLLRDPFPSDLDLIACRNVVIYFTDEAKDGLYKRFTGALRVGGTLFIGATEAINGPREFGLQMVSSGIYRRIE